MHSPVSKGQLWGGRIASAIPVLMLLLSAVMKLLQPGTFSEGWQQFGYPINLAVPIGIVELLCAVIYVIPRTAVLGAILVTGYLGGAVATHVRMEDPAFVTAVVLGVLAWLGLYLRDPRLRKLLPLVS